MRAVNVIRLCTVVCVLLATEWVQAASRTSGRPNLIVMLVDDISPQELGCYGNTINRTPNLDRLAKTGVRFSTCWGGALCMPSRAELLTGKYATRTHWWGNSMRPEGKEEGAWVGLSHEFFSHHLHDLGYHTAGFGKWHLNGVPNPQPGPGQPTFLPRNPNGGGDAEGESEATCEPTMDTFGFDELHFGYATYDSTHCDRVRSYIKRRSGEKDPFLIYYASFFAHRPWKSLGDPMNPGQRLPPGIKTSVEYTDYLVGQIIQTLNETGLRDNTIFFFTADNGTKDFGKGRVSELGVRLPLIVNGPERYVKGRGPCDALVDFSDLLPTLVELGGGAPPKEIDGRSFAAVLSGKAEASREWIFAYLHTQRALRTKDWYLDGSGGFWRVTGKCELQDYEWVTDSKDPQVLAARARFDELLKRLPLPDPELPYVKRMRAEALEGFKAKKEKLGGDFEIPELDAYGRLRAREREIHREVFPADWQNNPARMKE